ncbi:hypothetical protein [Sphingomonas sp.]|uniref:hypothetical protein n=1 Tax=Sphingomonas sp. TaxID=28214 RepID=UPI0025F3F390|nr:hypothetical protein [Sphingomonas sp.]MBV9527936.1 hypothetical protein [Sphingomonas sp.]
MWRITGSAVAGLLAWVVFITLLNFALRAAIPGYHAAETTLVFTPAMKTGRLVEAALASLAAGAVVRLIAPASKWAPWIVGLILLAMFLPEHAKLWNRFPLWYHLSFLVPLAPLVAAGAVMVTNSRSVRQPAVS